jgi:hypothetical protein
MHHHLRLPGPGRSTGGPLRTNIARPRFDRDSPRVGIDPPTQPQQRHLVQPGSGGDCSRDETGISFGQEGEPPLAPLV